MTLISTVWGKKAGKYASVIKLRLKNWWTSNNLRDDWKDWRVWASDACNQPGSIEVPKNRKIQLMQCYHCLDADSHSAFKHGKERGAFKVRFQTWQWVTSQTVPVRGVVGGQQQPQPRCPGRMHPALPEQDWRWDQGRRVGYKHGDLEKTVDLRTDDEERHEL